MVSIQIFMMGLLAVSVFTTLTTQAIKKLVREFGGKVFTNTLASVVSVILAAALGIAYGIVNELSFDAPYIVCMVALAFLGWICATNGYDKVKQAIKQVISGGDLDNAEDKYWNGALMYPDGRVTLTLRKRSRKELLLQS